MEQIVCKIIGHKHFDAEVMAIRPWDLADFRGYSPEQFRSLNCERCGATLEHDAA
jgi:hypothetical protein